MRRLKRRRTFIHLALSLMAADCITGLMRAFLPDAGPSPPVTVVVLTLLTWVPLEISRWVRGLRLRDNLRRGILAALYVFLALLTLSAGFYNSYGLFGGGWMDRMLRDELSNGTFVNQTTSLVLVALCWWLGVTLGDMRLTHTNLLRYFYICLLALILPSIFFVSDVSQDLPWLYFMFLFVGMVTLGLGRVEEVARRSQDQEGAPFTVYWLAQNGLTAGILLGLMGLAHVLKLAQGFGLILALVMPVVALVVFPIVYVGAKLLILSGFTLTPVDLGAEEAELAEAAARVAEPSTAESLCVGLVILAFTLVIVWAIFYGVRRWRKIVQEQEVEERATLPSLGDRVSEMVRERLERLRVDLPGLGRLRRHLATRSIRRIYAALTALGTERGYPRPAARTPYEHLPVLRHAFPSCEMQVEQITEAYVATHYGQVPETREALREIKAAWQHVREMAHRSGPASARGAPSSSGVAGLQDSSRV